MKDFDFIVQIHKFARAMIEAGDADFIVHYLDYLDSQGPERAEEAEILREEIARVIH